MNFIYNLLIFNNCLILIKKKERKEDSRNIIICIQFLCVNLFSFIVYLCVLLKCVKCFLIIKEMGVGVFGCIGGWLVYVLEVVEKGLKL